MSALSSPTRAYPVAAGILMGLALIVALWCKLLPALLIGFLVHELTCRLAACLPGGEQLHGRRKALALALLAGTVVLAVTVAIVGLISFFRADHGGLTLLLSKMADILEASRSRLPAGLADALPEHADALRSLTAQWLHSHASELGTLGREAGRSMAHVLIGMVIGALLALRRTTPGSTHGPLADALSEQCRHFASAFRRIVFAQIKISAINTTLTALYLSALLPAAGVHLPLTKSLIAVTFLAGLIPVLGNLISNTVIVIVSLAHSPEMAITSLVFLVVVHKLEYFLNARIVGAGVGARAWELLIAMLTMEALFGLAGLVAAPIYYAYLKGELQRHRLIEPFGGDEGETGVYHGNTPRTHSPG